MLLAELGQRLGLGARRAMQRRRGPFDSLGHKLEALSPRRVLERGYSLSFGQDGRLLTDAAVTRPGDRIRVALRRGELDTEFDQDELAKLLDHDLRGMFDEETR